MTAPAAAQLGLPAATQNAHSTYVRGIDAAYHPDHDVFLVVGGQGSVQGVFVNANGAAVTAPFAINTSGYGTFPRVAFSRQANGGQGGFLVAWASEEGPAVIVRGRMIAYPGTALGPQTVLSGGVTSWLDVGVLDVAYSPTSQRFLLAWKSFPDTRLFGALVDNNANPVGAPLPLSTTFGRDPGVVWNPTNDEFGVSFSVETASTVASVFVRVPASNLAGFGRTTFNIMPPGMTTATDIAFNPNTGRYIMGWFQIGGEGGVTSRVAEIAADGTVISSGIASFRIGSYDAFSLGVNAVSRTALLVGVDRVDDTVLGAELNASGYRFSPELTLGATNRPASSPRVAESTASARWLVTSAGGVAPSSRFQFLAAQAVTTGTTNGGPAGTYGSGGGGSGSTGGCPGTAPFPGAVCVGGNWIPGTTDGGSGGSTGGCPGTAPFPGAVCVGGNWIPGTTDGGSGGSTGGCTSVNPGAGFTCVNGSWLYTGTTSGGSTGGCTSVNPGAGFTCVNGSWLYTGTTSGGSTGGCTTVNPGPGFTCVNGGWVSSGGSGGSTTASKNGDFDRNGKSDLLFQNTSGQLVRWGMSGTQLVMESMMSSATASSVLRVVATGDLTGDGHADVLWQNTTNGHVFLNIMQGTTLVGQQAIQGTNTAWRVVGTADINRDTHIDIVWHHPGDGRIWVWYMRPQTGNVAGHAGAGNTPSNAFVVLGANPAASGDPGWSPGGIGDFNADGVLDLAWQHADGRLRVWYLNGVTLYYDAVLTTAAAGWRLAVIGDVIGDTKIDVVWQNTTTGSLSFYTYSYGPDISARLTKLLDIAAPASSVSWRLVAAK